MKLLNSHNAVVNWFLVFILFMFLGTETLYAGPPDGISEDGEDNSVGLALDINTLEDHPLSEVSRSAADFVANSSVPIGVAVVVPGRGIVYTSNGDTLFPLASVAKLFIMAALLGQTAKDDRSLNDHQLSLLESMITESDNDAATELWREIGGATRISEYLNHLGIRDTQLDETEYWGDSRASAKDVAFLLSKLLWDREFDKSSRLLAADLMSRVVASQRWGVRVGLEDNGAPGIKVGVKDGWYPDETGWWTNSAGFFVRDNRGTGFTIAILTQGEPTLSDGIQTIEDIATPIEGNMIEQRAAGPIDPDQ